MGGGIVLGVGALTVLGGVASSSDSNSPYASPEKCRYYSREYVKCIDAHTDPNNPLCERFKSAFRRNGCVGDAYLDQ